METKRVTLSFCSPSTFYSFSEFPSYALLQSGESVTEKYRQQRKDLHLKDIYGKIQNEIL